MISAISQWLLFLFSFSLALGLVVMLIISYQRVAELPIGRLARGLLQIITWGWIYLIVLDVVNEALLAFAGKGCERLGGMISECFIGWPAAVLAVAFTVFSILSVGKWFPVGWSSLVKLSETLMIATYALACWGIVAFAFSLFLEAIASPVPTPFFDSPMQTHGHAIYLPGKLSALAQFAMLASWVLAFALWLSSVLTKWLHDQKQS